MFFYDNGNEFHEIGIYYLVNIDNIGFKYFDATFKTKENQKINTYEWLEIDNLNDTEIYPKFIKKEIKNTEQNLKLIITNELD